VGGATCPATAILLHKPFYRHRNIAQALQQQTRSCSTAEMGLRTPDQIGGKQ
jgi:hypothetical protein